MEEKAPYQPDGTDTVSGILVFCLSLLFFYCGLKIDFFPLWFAGAFYLSLFALAFISYLFEDSSDTSDTSESAIRKHSQP